MKGSDGQNKGNQRSNVQRFLGVYENLININLQRMLRKLSMKTFQELSHLTFSEHFFASREVM